jgi:hypothetical protein
MKVLTNLARTSVIGFLTMAVVLSLAASLQAQTTTAKAKVQAIKGTVFYTAPGATSKKPLKVGALLAPGTLLETMANSSVDIYFGRMAGMVRMTEKTKFAVDKYTLTQTGADSVIDLNLKLDEGTILGTVNKLSAASKYTIKTPDGVAGVRGTHYTLTVRRDANGVMKSILVVSDGIVVIIRPTAAVPGAVPGTAANGSVTVQTADGMTTFTVTGGGAVQEDGSMSVLTAAEAATALATFADLDQVLQEAIAQSTQPVPEGELPPPPPSPGENFVPPTTSP